MKVQQHIFKVFNTSVSVAPQHGSTERNDWKGAKTSDRPKFWHASLNASPIDGTTIDRPKDECYFISDTRQMHPVRYLFKNCTTKLHNLDFLYGQSKAQELMVGSVQASVNFRNQQVSTFQIFQQHNNSHTPIFCCYFNKLNQQSNTNFKQ